MGPENPRALSISGLLPLIQSGGLLDISKGNYVVWSYNNQPRQNVSSSTGTTFSFTLGQLYSAVAWTTYSPGNEPPSFRTTTGTSNTTLNRWWLLPPGIWFDNDSLIIFEAYCRINQASTSTQRFQFNFGFDNVITGTRQNEFLLTYRDDVNSGNWGAWGVATDVALGSSTAYYVNSNIAPIIGEYCRFKAIIYNKIITFYINDIFILSTPWNPTFPSQSYLIGCSVQLDKLVGTTAVTMDMQWMRMLQIYNYTQNHDY